MRVGSRGLGLAVFALLLGVWEVAGRVGVYRGYLPAVSRILAAGAEMVVSGELPSAVRATLQAWATGYLSASLLGVVVGAWLGYSPVAYRLMVAFIELLRPIPSVATIPLAVLLFGLSTKMQLAVITYAAIWPVMINTMYGVSRVDPILIHIGRMFRYSPPVILWKVALPSAIPLLLAGLRISLNIALILTIISEMVTGVPGIGAAIEIHRNAYNLPQMYAGIFTAGLLGYLLNLLFGFVQQRILRWHAGGGGSPV